MYILRGLSAKFLVIIFSIFVAATAAKAANDSVIEVAIKAKYALEKDLPMSKINVKSESGVVKLSGVVDTNLQAENAVEIAMTTLGVVDVDDSDLKLSDNKMPITDTIITAKVKGKIAYLKMHDKLSSLNDINVETKNATIHLNGTAYDNTDKQKIIDAVSKISNAQNVKENIDLIRR